ncbi:MAG TPA: energy transducer TonB [Burkholderiaceae bacterium]|jgi:protein TonB
MSTFSRLILATAVLGLSFAASAADTVAALDTKIPCDKPEYPRASLVNEEQGTVVLSLQIAVDGKVSDSKVEKSSGFKNLDKATLKLANCHFKPLLKDGKPEQSWAKFEYIWKLD